MKYTTYQYLRIFVMSKGNNNNLKIKIMTTNERIAKLGIDRDEKIANLKKLGLWNEYCNEVKKSGPIGPTRYSGRIRKFAMC